MPATTNNLVKQVPLDQINSEFTNIRNDYDPEKIRELALSMEGVGLLQPILIRKEGELYSIVCGHRRYLAAKALSWPTIKAVECKFDDGESDIAKVHENIFRQDISPIEEAKYYLYLMEKYGYTEVEVGKRIHKTVGYVSQHLKILTYCPELRVALEDGKIPFSVARELNQINGLMRRRSLIKAAIENGITARTAALWRKEANEVIETENQSGREMDEEPKKQDPTDIPTIACGMCDNPVKVSEIRSLICCPVCHGNLLQIREELLKREKEQPKEGV